MQLIPKSQKLLALFHYVHCPAGHLALITNTPSLPSPVGMASKSLTLSTLILAACLELTAAQGSPGTATFYGEADGSGTMGKLGGSPALRMTIHLTFC